MPGRTPRVATVQRTSRLTDHLIRIELGGPGLDGFAAGEFSDHYVKLQLPPPGAGPDAKHKTRTYTVREWDAEAGLLTIDFVHHGDSGVAGPWAAAARPGDQLQLLGPGGAYTPDPAADWHLMVGDTAVIPAIAASLPRVPAGVPVHVLIDVDGPGDELELDTPADLRLTWLHGGDLEEAVRALELPAGRGHAFVHGEASMVREVRRHLVLDRGMAKEDLSASGYWKRSRTEEGWREDKAEWNRQADQDLATQQGGQSPRVAHATPGD